MDSKPGRGTLSKQKRRRCMDARFMKKPSGPEYWTKAGFTQLCKSALPEGYRIHREALKVLDSAATAAMAQVFANANICVQFNGRSEVQSRDLHSVATIRRDDLFFEGWKPVEPTGPPKRSKRNKRKANTAP